MRNLWLALLALALLGCGGGGGVTATANILGRVLWVESNASTDPAATVSAGGQSTATDLIDGFFQLTVTRGTSSATVSFTPSGSSTPIVRTFTFAPVVGTVNLGDLYIGPDEVTVHGTVTDASDGSPVQGATVKLAGRTATTDFAGEFNLLNVAYSSTSPAAFGDLVGEVSKAAFVTRQFNPPITATLGVVEVGTIVISPESLTDPPPFPSNLTGTILPSGDGAGALVEILDGVTVIRTTTADGLGQYGVWLPVGTFTVRATAGPMSGNESVTMTSTNVQKIVNVNVS